MTIERLLEIIKEVRSDYSEDKYLDPRYARWATQSLDDVKRRVEAELKSELGK
ncbi:hypothetical protein [Oceanobacillus sp. FSL H7-0719]|uniref:hypothetical protein n=1 Tax=Oceanobacillus sp. FSL H7-0719 TaxID=2954507 RepID=UPI003244779F